MFVGFIAIIVVLLIIVAAMSTGSTSGSGGVDQTQATKVLSEFSGLSQSFDFYKTTTTYSNYDLLDVAGLESNGIVASADISGGAILSKALSGVTYTVTEDENGTPDDETDDNDAVKVTVVSMDATVSESARLAVAATLESKLGFQSNGTTRVAVVSTTNLANDTITITE